jgi:hypothetical protein
VAACADELPLPAKHFQLRGAASCAAVACHNASGPLGSKGAEYSTWITRDPHTKAYTALYNSRSQGIEQALYRLPSGKYARAEKDTLCLKCHGIDMDQGDRAPLSLSDSFSCESCHGPAEKWLSQHYLADWRQKSIRAKADLGMRATKDLLVRAEMCVSCHVGGPDREVNHDLIAAGHPRLNFEYSSFLAILPKHWDERDEKRRYPDLEARTWAIGQAASARAALQLLAARAEPKNRRLWPEFAEYDCFACHHDLQSPSWRQERDVKKYAKSQEGPKAGALPWGTWYMSMLPEALATQQPTSDSQLLALINGIRSEMGKTYPNPEHIASQARVAADGLHAYLSSLASADYADGAILNQLLASIARDHRKVAAANWDGAAQVYLALTAVYQAQADVDPLRRDRRLASHFNEMVSCLGFPKVDVGAYSSPRDMLHADAARKFLQELERIQDHLGR